MRQSGEEIFDRLQRQEGEAKRVKESADMERMQRWYDAILRIMPLYRAAAPILSERCEHLMDRIIIRQARTTGAPKRKWENKDPRIDWEEYRTVGWYLLDRTWTHRAWGADDMPGACGLYFLHDGQFLERHDGRSETREFEVNIGHKVTAQFLDDSSIIGLYLAAENPGQFAFEGCFVRLFRAAGLDMPASMYLPRA
jgi:hypothetical protein